MKPWSEIVVRSLGNDQDLFGRPAAKKKTADRRGWRFGVICGAPVKDVDGRKVWSESGAECGVWGGSVFIRCLFVGE